MYSDEEAEQFPDPPETKEEVAEKWREIERLAREDAEDSSDEEDPDPSADDGVAEKADSAGYEEVDDALLDAIKKSSWWEVTEYRNGTELSKAPSIWRHDDQVPERVQELIEKVIENTHWNWGAFESLTDAQANELAEMLEEKLTQPQGWSISSLSRDIQTEFNLDEEVAVGIASDTTHSVLNESREEAYEQMEGSEEFEYEWLNPQDNRTTPVCWGIIEEIEDRGGSVTMPTLKQIVREQAVKYEGTSEGGGTPDRVDQWKPHYRCRSTFARSV
jgi:rubrerythrin